MHFVVLLNDFNIETGVDHVPKNQNRPKHEIIWGKIIHKKQDIFEETSRLRCRW